MGLSFIEGLGKSASMILVSEVGDKTFFVAALMAMRYSRRLVLIGSLGALWVMTALSAAFGWAAPNLIPRAWTHNATTSLFFIFGLKSLWDGFTSAGGESAELKEVEAHLNDDHKEKVKRKASTLALLISPVVLEAFSLTFLGEWGDRSQLATIGLAAQENVYGVTLGGMIGHAICTGVAVVGGKHLATRISEKLVAISGGLLFIGFGFHSLFY